MPKNEKNKNKKSEKEFHYSRTPFILALNSAAKLLAEHEEDVNRLNVFPVPDGDTGSNMASTLNSVCDHVSKLGDHPSVSDIRHQVTTGALMGARGNSGVIFSQILRGLCEGYEKHEFFDTEGLAAAFTRAEEVAFAAVRKPIEGTILTVLKDSAKAARYTYRKKMAIDKAVVYVSEKAYESVENTPELLPVLKENNVVDAGGYGLAIFIEGIAAALTGIAGQLSEELENAGEENYQPKVEIEQINDWAGSKYRYCNEFLVDSNSLDTEEALQFLATLGDCELCVGAKPKFKVHVHSDHPDQVLAYFLERGQISEVFIHNMQLQSEERVENLENGSSGAGDSAGSEGSNAASQEKLPHKEIAVVAVAAGRGNAEILKSLGVDIVVSGGQTMNPSTKDLADAATRANADNVLFLPNNKNIIMAAKSACDVCEFNTAVLETRDLPSAFSAMMSFDSDSSLQENVEEMTDIIEDIQTAEITTAIKDSQDFEKNPIKKGQTIGITGGEIKAVGESTDEVLHKLLDIMDADGADVMTILGGADITNDELEKFVEGIETEYPDLEVDSHMGGQPVYPIIFSLE